jgi:hypothetical protein
MFMRAYLGFEDTPPVHEKNSGRPSLGRPELHFGNAFTPKVLLGVLGGEK